MKTDLENSQMYYKFS